MQERDQSKAMGCPICNGGDVTYIENDKNSVLLYECRNCRKFIMNKNTLKNLLLRPDFNEHRMGISAYVRLYFETCQRPLEIVLKREKGMTRQSIEIDKILNEIKNKTLFEIGCDEEVSRKGSSNVIFR